MMRGQPSAIPTAHIEHELLQTSKGEGLYNIFCTCNISENSLTLVGDAPLVGEFEEQGEVEAAASCSVPVLGSSWQVFQMRHNTQAP